MKKTVIYDEETKEVLAIGYDDTWVLPVGVGVRAYEGNDEPVLTDIGGRMFLKDNAIITRIEL